MSVSDSLDDDEGDAPPLPALAPPASILPPPIHAKLSQKKLYYMPTAKHRLVACKLSGIFDEVTRMRAGGLNVLVYPLNPFHSPGKGDATLQIRDVFEERSSGNIGVDVREAKKDGCYYNLGLCELFGIVNAAEEAAGELCTPNMGVVVASTQCGDAAKFFVKLALASAKSTAAAKRFKARPSSSKPKAGHLVEFVDLYKKTPTDARRQRLEDYYYETLQDV